MEVACQFVADVLDNHRRGGGGKGQNGNIGQDGADSDYLQVGRTEIVTPLADAVCLVDGDKADAHVAQLGDKEVAAQSFWGDVEELGTPEDAVLQGP